MATPDSTSYRWLRNGSEAFARMLEAIDSARQSVRLETYSFKESQVGLHFREALIRACQRGARVRLVIDFIGSHSLRTSFWDPFVAMGGEFRWFNPWNPWVLGIRDHRKILVCDEAVGFVGGFNIAPEYEGDGVVRGWRDLGLEIQGPLARALAACFDDSFSRADFKPKKLQRLRRSPFNKILARENWTLLLSGPGRGRKYLKRMLIRDLSQARSVRIIAAYFLPPWRLRKKLQRIARHGGRVEIILPSQSDVALSILASRCLYRRFLQAGVIIHEYRPQILHAKLIIIDGAVYVGSANLDPRSLNINYELLVRATDRSLVSEAHEIFRNDLKHCRLVHPAAWAKARPFWKKWFERWAYWILARLDPYLARLHARDVP
jgi:cardiolipin synthase A/B